MDLRKANELLTTYIRPQTYPVAIGLIRSEDELPRRVKMPKRDLGHHVALCQGIAIARRYGWAVAMGEEDMNCPLGAVTLGFLPPLEKYLDGTYEMPFWGDQPTRAKMIENTPRLDFGQYKYAIAAPLERVEFDAQIILVYGNPAQIARLMQGQTYSIGQPITSIGLGIFACSAEITRPFLTGEPQLIVPGGGERSVAKTQDDEMCISIPVGKLEMILDGVEATHKAGTRYPTVSYLTYEAEFMPGYKALLEYLHEEGGAG